jgi:hypothetical protein
MYLKCKRNRLIWLTDSTRILALSPYCYRRTCSVCYKSVVSKVQTTLCVIALSDVLPHNWTYWRISTNKRVLAAWYEPLLLENCLKIQPNPLHN